jgi:hypothetical protein
MITVMFSIAALIIAALALFIALRTSEDLTKLTSVAENLFQIGEQRERGQVTLNRMFNTDLKALSDSARRVNVQLKQLTASVNNLEMAHTVEVGNNGDTVPLA